MVGLLGRLFLGSMPVSFAELAYLAIGGMIGGMVFGILFPRVVTVVLYPVVFFGSGCNWPLAQRLRGKTVKVPITSRIGIFAFQMGLAPW